MLLTLPRVALRSMLCMCIVSQSQVLQYAAAVVQVICLHSIVLRVAILIVQVTAAAPRRCVACVMLQVLQATCM